jgi:pyrimidine deaminase RibD-like protein
MSRAEHESWMRETLAEASRGWGDTHPNPMVGAMIVEDGRVVAVGHHARAGGPHAEVAALNALGRSPWEGATLYVTLEPCSTQGRTAPCSEAIIASGIRHVVAGATHPKPQHAGRGYNVLREIGIDVDHRNLDPTLGRGRRGGDQATDHRQQQSRRRHRSQPYPRAHDLSPRCGQKDVPIEKSKLWNRS